jgi:hypothetical protein
MANKISGHSLNLTSAEKSQVKPSKADLLWLKIPFIHLYFGCLELKMLFQSLIKNFSSDNSSRNYLQWHEKVCEDIRNINRLGWAKDKSV